MISVHYFRYIYIFNYYICLYNDQVLLRINNGLHKFKKICYPVKNGKLNLHG